MKVLKASAIAALLLAALQGCSSHRFVATGDASKEDSKGAHCRARVLRTMPSVPHRELGLCYASVPGGGIFSDKTPEAIEELQKCACEAGGDAVVLDGTSDQGVMSSFGASQQTVKAQGVVILRGAR